MTYGTIVVCGGGCYGGYYVRQLARARAAGALSFDQLIVVDRDPQCAVARLIEAIGRDDVAEIAHHAWHPRRPDTPVTGRATPEVANSLRDFAYRGLPIEFVAADWDAFFARWLGAAIRAPQAARHDAVVPSPLMPHLLADWVASRIAARHPGVSVTRAPLSAEPETPWRRSAPDLAHYASFATWMCPINCIEPARCPETRGPRDWSMPVAVRRATDNAAQSDAPFDVVALFQTTHRAFGVGMFDVADALRAETAIAQQRAGQGMRVLVASVSHCHGALAELHVTAGGPVAAVPAAAPRAPSA